MIESIRCAISIPSGSPRINDRIQFTSLSDFTPPPTGSQKWRMMKLVSRWTLRGCNWSRACIIFNLSEGIEQITLVLPNNGRTITVDCGRSKFFLSTLLSRTCIPGPKNRFSNNRKLQIAQILEICPPRIFLTNSPPKPSIDWGEDTRLPRKCASTFPHSGKLSVVPSRRIHKSPTASLRATIT
jgi:hypothetical protein